MTYWAAFAAKKCYISQNSTNPLFDKTAAAVVQVLCISATPHLGTSFPLFHGTHTLSCDEVCNLSYLQYSKTLITSFLFVFISNNSEFYLFFLFVTRVSGPSIILTESPEAVDNLKYRIGYTIHIPQLNIGIST